MSNDADNADKVGYKNPPRHSRFKPGQSGNPKGRKKGAVGFNDVVARTFSKKMKIREGDKEVWVTRLEALLLSQMASALKGDRHAVARLLPLAELLQDGDNARNPRTSAEQAERFRQIIENFSKRRQSEV